MLPATSPAASPAPFRDHDLGGNDIYNIVPPGQNGYTTAAGAAAFLATGQRPPHQYDQNDMYANLVYRAPKLRHSEIERYYKEASFGVRPEDVGRVYGPNCAVTLPPSPGSPHCEEVTIVRDQGFGVPHVYGDNRAGLMFGLGYVTGEDRLFLADALRHAGRADLSSFAGGASAGQDHDTFSSAPYMSDSELMAQFENGPEIAAHYGFGRAAGLQIQQDVQNYVDGINQFLAEISLDPINKLDVLYTATGNPPGTMPEPWTVADVIAAGSLVAGIFGKGGGGEVRSAVALQDARKEFGKRKGRQIWDDFRSGDDPEAPTTVHDERFPYRVPPGGKPRGLAMPDPGSVEAVPVVKPGSQTGSARVAASKAGGILGEILAPLRQISEGSKGASNALVVSAREAEKGRPLAVFGPQTGYFAPQLLMEIDSHAPATPEHGPAIHARGVAFVGTNLYVQLGRGVDYSFSATSAGQDIVDTFAIRLCEPGGGKPTKRSLHYLWNGRCIPMDVIEHENSWVPSAADQSGPGGETLQAFRTKAGLVSHVATIDGKPVAYTRLRATYGHEVDAALAFSYWNQPATVKGPRDFIRAGFANDLTFNWFYVDANHIAYYNSGANPVRARGTHPAFPVLAKKKFMWRNFDPKTGYFRHAPLSSHAQAIDQRFLTSWNNQQAHGIWCDTLKCYTSVYRSTPLDDRIRKGIRGSRRMSLTDLINAMEDAGTVDLRGDKVVPVALQVLGDPKRIEDDAARRAAVLMSRWVKKGAHRRDKDNDGAYDQAEAVKIMDAWWPLWVDRQFTPVLGKELKETFIGSGGAIHDAPGAIGSAFQGEVYGFVHKDLRTLLGKKVRGRYSRVYCGKGERKACRKMLIRTLAKAAAATPADVYRGGGCTLNNGTNASAQMCHDAVNAADVTVAAVDEFHWINRPTFQQAVQFRRHR